MLNDLATKVLACPWSSDHYQLLVMGFVAHAALLQASELCTPKMGDVTFSDDGVSCTQTIHKSKANKLGPPERVPLVDFAPMAVAALRTHMWKYAQQDPAVPLFARQSSKSTRQAFSVYQFRKDFRALLAKAEYLEMKYSGHSFRSGGATDLWHAGCRDHAIRLHGRWRSDAFYIYIRDNPCVSHASI